MRRTGRLGGRGAGIAACLVLIAGCSEGGGGADEAPPVQAGEPVTEAPAQAAALPPEAPGPTSPRVFDVRAIRTVPHDTSAFTQGLFFADGTLYESTGKRGASVIRKLDMTDGSTVQEAKLPDEIFGEGATVVGDRIVSLSWRAGLGFVHDLETLAPEGTFEIEGEGWGLTYDPETDRLVLSDGTPQLRFLDPDTYEEIGTLTATLNGRPIPKLNELEYVDGQVWANVWQQDFIVRIDPGTGVVTGVIDVSGLYPAPERADPRDDVPNGIAYDPASGRLIMTGKRWPALYEVELTERTR